MGKKKFEDYSIEKINKYKNAIKRKISIKEGFYKRPGDLRTEFARDYTRIIHCFGFRRLKHKTQVFFHPYNDHVCTRMEHALHVASISNTICKELGLNSELVNAIAIGHDLGHAPFGHHGESVLDEIWKVEIEGLNEDSPYYKKKYFWHEKNGLFWADNIETVKDDKGFQKNLNLTYAVRDGIICHCGEEEIKPLIPRNKSIKLEEITEAGKTVPYTWEGCIVRIADVIAYLGRDIEDAEMSDLVDDIELNELRELINQKTNYNLEDISNSVVIHYLIVDLCKNSFPEEGLAFSSAGLELLNRVRKFDRKSIYYDEKIKRYKRYASLVLETIFNELKEYYQKDIVDSLLKMKKQTEPVLQEFIRFIERYHVPFDGKYSEKDYISSIQTREKVKKVFDIKNEEDYKKAVIYYLSGFTDNFAISSYDTIKSII